MANSKEISNKNLKGVAGGTDDDREGFMLKVEYSVYGSAPTLVGEKHYMTHWVEMETTIENIETWTCNRCNVSSISCQTFHNGKLCNKTDTVGELEIWPFEKLEMFIRTN